MPKSKAFRQLYAALSREYLGDKVPRKYQSRYGKRYDKSDVKSFAYAVAKSKGIPIERGQR